MEEDITSIYSEVESTRSICLKCERPQRVCWCEYVINPPINLKKSKIVILQHPNERKRPIRTAKILQQSLDTDDCLLFVRRKITSLELHDNLNAQEKSLRILLNHPKAYILFPKEDAYTPEDLVESIVDDEKIILIVLDGTWNEARKMYSWSHPLQKLPKMKLEIEAKSQFVVKTQPKDNCLSTVECVSYALAKFENRPEIVEELTKPLLALCSVQISHGAVKHDSLEFKRDIDTFEKQNCRRPLK